MVTSTLATTLATRWWWAAAALAVALAITCWPATPGRTRLGVVVRAPADPPSRIGRWLRSGPPEQTRPILLVGASALLGAMVAGIGGGLAGATLGGLTCQRRRSASRGRVAEGELAALRDAVGVMAAELRAGAHPANAAAAAATGSKAVHRVLASVSLGARLGAEIPALLRRHAAGEPAIAGELSRLAAAWALADRHGVALAELMDAVRADLDARVRLTGQVRAQLAGPRATAAVLAGLPLLGVALGQGIGANPWHVLTGTPPGQVLLVVGAGLTTAGMLWSGRIMAKAVPG